MADNYQPSAEEIKAAARAIARAMNRDPDAAGETGFPYWQSYRQAARDALTAALKVRPSTG